MTGNKRTRENFSLIKETFVIGFKHWRWIDVIIKPSLVARMKSQRIKRAVIESRMNVIWYARKSRNKMDCSYYDKDSLFKVHAKSERAVRSYPDPPFIVNSPHAVANDSFSFLSFSYDWTWARPVVIKAATRSSAIKVFSTFATWASLQPTMLKTNGTHWLQL